ncbi:MAG: galactokinase [Chloroflexi bacterium]|nr:galactokinase [Chloroflexota bacterium]
MSVGVYAPGRVNLLGEHVDYNGGFVLPAAIDRYLRIIAQPVDGDVITLNALDLQQQVSFKIANLEVKQTLTGEPLPGWALYPAGVCWALARQGFHPQAVTAEYTSTIPSGAGLSSSAAIETAFGLLWQVLGDWQIDRMKLAEICLDAEINYVGVNCGIMDQFACLHGQAGHVLFLDTQTLEWEAIPFPDTNLVVANTGTIHQLGAPSISQYNQRRNECEQALRMLMQVLPGIQSLRDVTPDELGEFEHVLPVILRKRARHVVEECRRVQIAADCLRRQEWREFGNLMVAGHASLRDLYDVSSPELDALVEIAAGLPGCLGARLTGAGFGGCTINLVDRNFLEPFIAGLGEGYRQMTGREAGIFSVRTSRGAWVENSINTLSPFHSREGTGGWVIS